MTAGAQGVGPHTWTMGSPVLERAGSLTGPIATMENRGRRQPGASEPRWQLFRCLCVIGDWPRALKQLQVTAQFEPDFVLTAHVYRDLIRAEVFRQYVFEGKREPGFLLPAPPWLGRLHAALALAAVGDTAGADRTRHLALAEVPDAPGQHDDIRFAWITDSDTRLGPVCEIVTGGRYAWLPFAQMQKLELGKPTALLDLLWRPATVTLADGVISRGFVPVRYAGSELGSDAVRLARETTWKEMGETGVIALGQRTWMTEGGDIAMLDVTTLVLSKAP